MSSPYTIATQSLKYYQKYNYLIFVALVLLSLLNGETTVFYLIYFFWWHEFIRILVDYFLSRQNKNAKIELKSTPKIISEAFFLMGIYLVFIIVFFGFIANWNNTELTMLNLKILLFQNWFFNINLLLVLGERIMIHKTEQEVEVHFGGFTPNMIVLHISIIIGAVVMFFIVKKYPDIFTPDNFWGSVIIILPFLLLKKLIPKIYLSR